MEAIQSTRFGSFCCGVYSFLHHTNLSKTEKCVIKVILLTLLSCYKLNRCYIKLSLVNILEMVFVFIEILFQILLFKGGVLIYAEHCIYIYIYIPCATCLHLLLTHSCLYYYLLRLQYTVLHIVFYCTCYYFLLLSLIFYFIFSIPIFMYILLCCVTYNCTLHGADLTYISLLVIFCIIVYVMNKNLEPWTSRGTSDWC